jgi:DNA-binding transcriptional regulator GbsR (MarR family)
MEDEARFYIEKVLESFGYPSASARIYAYLLLSKRPMTITELAEVTGLGKSTVSTALRLLEHDGLVYHTKVGKKKLYTARSAFNRLLLFPSRILKEYIVPLRATLEETGENPELLRDIREFENLTRKVIEFIEEHEKKERS